MCNVDQLVRGVEPQAHKPDFTRRKAALSPPHAHQRLVFSDQASRGYFFAFQRCNQLATHIILLAHTCYTHSRYSWPWTTPRTVPLQLHPLITTTPRPRRNAAECSFLAPPADTASKLVYLLSYLSNHFIINGMTDSAD